MKYNAENDNRKETEPIPEYWWPYVWFYCDGCGHEWQQQYYEGKSRKPCCPCCGDDFWVARLAK